MICDPVLVTFLVKYVPATRHFSGFVTASVKTIKTIVVWSVHGIADL